MLDVDRITVPIEEHLTRAGRIVRRFGDRTHSVILGVELDGERYVVKASTTDAGTPWLRNAVDVHRRVRHPSIVPLLHHFETPQGVALVYPWARGDALRDHVDATIPEIDDPASPYRRFLRLPAPERVGAIRRLVGAHVAVAEAGLAAVDLYDGSLIYDFERRELHVIDIDLYRPAPYVLDRDRQFGSSTFMAPEEHVRGATIDERTNVYTLGRFGLVLLGCARHEPPTRTDFAGSDEQWDVLVAATRPSPSDRLPTVAALLASWESAQPSTSRRNPSA